MKFNKTKYLVIKKIIPTDFANFLYNYSFLKKKVADKMFEKRYLSPYVEYFGTYSDEQVPNTYSHYSDITMETLLVFLKEKIEKNINIKLDETYTYFRIYKKGDVLERHIDRPSCQISGTLNLGGDPWPIYLDLTGGKNKAGKKILLTQGDLLVYLGCELEHWREEFEGDLCSQVFLHYNKKGSNNLFDSRPFLGLPKEFKSK
jgi:hypothetical protein|tara:strand:+ start:435 stop:1043 length:609 start_codon:yes stop_codon:yes gene_type:complete